ncbi:hypothetical protein RYH74_23120 [Pseudomonas sp. LSJ-87]|uniref:hypothetical protein n=1 Tax=unclassified Pseudomonas TaxID=196821 RepID=UPI00294132E8|nr:hypothetical protein [Pseudomonas sp. LSJ-87]MDV5100166.1 hypothetical protein [Pseudomonas sp. LSJ-87]
MSVAAAPDLELRADTYNSDNLPIAITDANGGEKKWPITLMASGSWQGHKKAATDIKTGTLEIPSSPERQQQ